MKKIYQKIPSPEIKMFRISTHININLELLIKLAASNLKL